HVLAEGAPEDDVEAARLEPAGRSDRADVRLGDLVAGADVLDHEQGAAQPLALRLAPRRADMHLAEREPCGVGLLDQGPQLLEIGRASCRESGGGSWGRQ